MAAKGKKIENYSARDQKKGTRIYYKGEDRWNYKSEAKGHRMHHEKS